MTVLLARARSSRDWSFSILSCEHYCKFNSPALCDQPNIQFERTGQERLALLNHRAARRSTQR